MRRAVELADFVNPVDRFQQSQIVKTSKDTEARGDLNLNIKRAKPNTAGPSSIPGPKTQEEVALKKCEKKMKDKKSDDKPEKSLKQTAIAVDQNNKQSTSTLDTSKENIPSSSTPKTKQKAKQKEIDSETRPEDILDTFQNRKLAPAEWENFADQLLKRRVQKVADDLRGHVQPATERDTRFEPPQGVSDDSGAKELGVRRSSSQFKSKESKRFGDPVKHSIKEVLEELSGGAFLKAALQEYRRRLTDFQERGDRPIESTLRLLERHLVRRKFGYATLDKGIN